MNKPYTNRHSITISISITQLVQHLLLQFEFYF